MLFAAVFSLVMTYLCGAPAVLGYASSLVKDSPFFGDNRSKQSSTEEGADTTKRLGSLRVMVADVRGDEEAGRIAFAPPDVDKRVKKGRGYD
jgi:hypothetical protein